MKVATAVAVILDSLWTRPTPPACPMIHVLPESMTVTKKLYVYRYNTEVTPVLVTMAISGTDTLARLSVWFRVKMVVPATPRTNVHVGLATPESTVKKM